MPARTIKNVTGFSVAVVATISPRYVDEFIEFVYANAPSLKGKLGGFDSDSDSFPEDIPDMAILAVADKLSFSDGAPNLEQLATMWRMCPQVTHIEGCDLDDEGLPMLQRFDKLSSLDFTASDVTDAGLSQVLGKIPRLQELTLQGCDITDAALVGLRSCGMLRMVNLVGTEVKTLEGLKGLDIFELYLDGELEEEALDVVASLPLVKLGLASEDLEADLVAAALSKLSTLCEVRLDVSNMDVAVRGLQKCPMLNRLEAKGTDITDAAMPAIAEMGALRQLFLDNSDELTDEGLAALAAHGALRALSVQLCDEVSDEGLQKVIAACPLAALDVAHCDNVTKAVAKGSSVVVNF